VVIVACKHRFLRLANRPPHRVVGHPRVDFGSGDLSVPQRPLHQVQTPGLPVQPGRKRVPQAVDREGAGDARLAQPPGKIELDLPGTDATAGLGAENGRVRATRAL
jgi:hypothetical protein